MQGGQRSGYDDAEMLRVIVLLLAVLLASCGQALASSEFGGFAKARDGDSLLVGGTEVRLFGIDAPERNQVCSLNGNPWACGMAAADKLAGLVAGKDVRCVSIGADQYGRVLGRCTVGAIDVNRTMVASGYAVAYRHYSMDYVPAEAKAKASKYGLWASKFELPSDFRKEESGRAVSTHSSPVKTRADAGSVSSGTICSIKGNQGANGWLYHLPGMPYYNQTRAEQMFCSEADAQAAGYRRAKVR